MRELIEGKNEGKKKGWREQRSNEKLTLDQKFVSLVDINKRFRNE